MQKKILWMRIKRRLEMDLHYTDFYLGYQFEFFKGRFFFEPAIGISYWPIRTSVPDSFKAVEQPWPNYSLYNLDLILDLSFN